MKHSIEQDDECYFAQEPNYSMTDFIQDVFVVNPLRDYFERQLEEEQSRPIKQ